LITMPNERDGVWDFKLLGIDPEKMATKGEHIANC
jgi:hypothetical protein